MVEEVYIYKCDTYEELNPSDFVQVFDRLFNEIHPGQTVVVKPNMVRESALDSDDWEHVITHGSVIKAVCLKVTEKLAGKGTIVVADSPETDANFNRICRIQGLYELRETLRNTTSIDFHIMDLRNEIWRKVDGVIVERHPNQGDPAGTIAINLGNKSAFCGKSCEDYYGSHFNKTETQKHHHGDVQEYLLARSVLNADVFISVPKLKTHKKAGMTCCLKNLVGINADKNWLPHHTEGFPEKGGDQYPEKSLKTTAEFHLQEKIKQILKRSLFLSRISAPFKKFFRSVFGDTRDVIRSGNWYKNDTVWRMILDLNRILFYYDSRGNILPHRREFIGVVDGIIAGEGNGPLYPERKQAGLLIVGHDPLAIDIVCAKIMGFDWRRIPTFTHAIDTHDLPITNIKDPETEIILVSNIARFNNKPLGQLNAHDILHFKPAPGWKGQIEL